MISRWLEESRNGTEAYASAVAAAFAHKFRLLQLFVLLGYSVMFVLCVLLIAYMRFNRNVALKGDSAAARKIILPAFEPLLWILGATTGTYSVLLTIGVSTRFYKMQVPLLVSELFYSGRQFVVLLVIIYMLQKSVTVPALVRSVAITLLLAFYSLPLALLLDKFDNKTLSYARFSHTVTILSRISLLSIYVFIFFKPPSRASVRSIREYCVFAFVYFGCTLAYTQILYEGNADVGFVMIYVTSIWAALGPVVVWRVLIADTAALARHGPARRVAAVGVPAETQPERARVVAGTARAHRDAPQVHHRLCVPRAQAAHRRGRERRGLPRRAALQDRRGRQGVHAERVQRGYGRGVLAGGGAVRRAAPPEHRQVLWHVRVSADDLPGVGAVPGQSGGRDAGRASAAAARAPPAAAHRPRVHAGRGARRGVHPQLFAGVPAPRHQAWQLSHRCRQHGQADGFWRVAQSATRPRAVTRWWCWWCPWRLRLSQPLSLEWRDAAAGGRSLVIAGQ
ncbi:hypothetical protein PINS_up022673 [Pythium insidiosum]|nr:hypothetical protein PINS_up022673 [Pythium insidiosum]